MKSPPVLDYPLLTLHTFRLYPPILPFVTILCHKSNVMVSQKDRVVFLFRVSAIGVLMLRVSMVGKKTKPLVPL